MSFFWITAVAILSYVVSQGTHHPIHDELREMHELEIRLRKENKPKEAMQIREQIRSKLHLLPKMPDMNEDIQQFHSIDKEEEDEMMRRRRKRRPRNKDVNGKEIEDDKDKWLDEILEENKREPRDKYRRSSRHFIEKVEEHVKKLRAKLKANKDQFTTYEMSLIEKDIDKYITVEKELMAMRSEDRDMEPLGDWKGSRDRKRGRGEMLAEGGDEMHGPEDPVERVSGEVPTDDAEHKEIYLENIRKGHKSRRGIDHELWSKKREANDMYRNILRRIQDPSPELR